MGQALKSNHMARIGVLTEKRNFKAMDDYLGRIAARGFDVAGVPFRVVDALLGDGEAEFGDIGLLAHHTAGAQPRLFQAIAHGLTHPVPVALCEIAEDTAAHPKTRFEAMGWAVYLAHRADGPVVGPAVGDVFQFWDDAPPPEIVGACADWARAAAPHVIYTEDTATDYIITHYGADAAKGFAQLWHPALKSDLFRIYRLLQDGGLYVDADSKPGYRIPAFCAAGGGRVWASSMTRRPKCVAINGFMAAPAGAPLVAAFLETALRNLADEAGRGVFWLTGPAAMTETLYRHLGQFDVGLLAASALKAEYFVQIDAPYKRSTQNWRVYENRRGMSDDAGLDYMFRT